MNRLEFEESIIGRGIQLPKAFDPSTKTVNSNTGNDRIRQSIYYILSTIKGERFLVPDFGSDLHKVIFEPNDDVLKDMIVYYTSEALTKWEPRIQVVDISPEIGSSGNIVPVNITYRIKSTNLVDNYVYPFEVKGRDLEEGDTKYE